MNRKTREIKNIIWQYKIVEYLGYLAIVSVPLFVGINHFSIFNTPKLLVMMAISLLMAIFFLWGNWEIAEFRIKFSPLNITLLFFILILTLSSIFGFDPLNSFLGWRSMMPLVTLYSFTIFALIMGSLIKKDKRIITNILSYSLLTSFLTIVFFYTGLPGSRYIDDGSTIGNSSYLGEYILFNFFFGVGLFIYFKTPWKKILVAIATLFIVINPLFINKMVLLGKIGISEIVHNPMMLLGIANGATMGIGLSVIFICFLFLVFSKKKGLKILGLILIVLLFIGIAFVGKQLVTPNTKLHEVFAETKSNNRFLVWDIARQGFSDHPIMGNGYNNYIYNYEKYYSADFYRKDYLIERFAQPHNVFWEFASNTGILGLVGYLGLLTVLFVTLYNIKNKEDNKRLNNLRIILAGVLLGYFVQGLFVFDTVCTYLTLFIVIAVGLGLTRDYELNLGNKYIFINKIFIILGISVCLYSIYPLVIAPWRESTGMNKIMNKTTDMKEFVKLREDVQEKSMFSGVMDDTYFAEKLFVLYQKNLSQVDEKNKKIFLRELDSIVKQIEKDIEIQPNYSESYLVISKMLNLYLLADMKNGDEVRFNGKNYNEEIWQKSYDSLIKASTLNQNDPQIYLAMSQLYLIKGDLENARFYSKKSLGLTPEYEEAYSFARGLLKISPNKDFESYLNEMETKWILK